MQKCISSPSRPLLFHITIRHKTRRVIAAWLLAVVCWQGPIAIAQTDSPELDQPPNVALPVGIAPTTIINMAIEQGWNERDVTPAALCSDDIFLRRVYIDLAGRIPSADEADRFLSDTNSSKRRLLVQEILQGPEFARHAAELFDAVLLGRVTRDRAYQKRRESGWFEYLESAFHANRPWNQVVNDILLARPVTGEQRGSQWFLYEKGDKFQELAEAISPGFFGVQIQCAQCHDHPSASEIEQRHYWGLVAFFNRGKRAEIGGEPRVAESAIGGFSKFTDLSGMASNAELTFLGTDRIVPEARPEVEEETKSDDPATDSDHYLQQDEQGNALQPPIPRFSRRQQFVEVIVNDNPLVAKAFVNRVWGWLMGRGIIHPVDRMDSTTPASHPELLEWLARDFANHGYDVHRLIAAIIASVPYQLDSTPTSERVGEEAFAWCISRPMSAETYYRSLLQLVDASCDQEKIDELLEFQAAFPDLFTEVSLTTLPQSLFLSNNHIIQQLVDRGAVSTWRGDTPTGEPNMPGEWIPFVDRLYRAAYSRLPNSEEREAVAEYLVQRAERPQAAIAQTLWVITTSGEFRFNH